MFKWLETETQKDVVISEVTQLVAELGCKSSHAELFSGSWINISQSILFLGFFYTGWSPFSFLSCPFVPSRFFYILALSLDYHPGNSFLTLQHEKGTQFLVPITAFSATIYHLWYFSYWVLAICLLLCLLINCELLKSTDCIYFSFLPLAHSIVHGA